MRSSAVLTLAILVAGAAFASSEFPSLVSTPTDPTEFGSLRMDPFESVAPAESEWVIVLTGSYFNQWNGTWHTRRVHEDRGRQRQPIDDDELRFIEQAFPDDEVFYLDLEGSRMDLLLARGLRGGVTVQLRVPWITIGSPAWDSAAEAFHNLVPTVEHYVRDLFPRGETFLYVRTGGRSLLRREELRQSGLGDVSLSVGVPLGRSARLTHRLVFAVEFPTGRKNSLHGSGGYDVGIRWFGSRQGRRNEWLFGAGFTRQDPSGSFLGLQRSDTYHLSADLVRRLSTRTALHAGARYDSSPLYGLTDLPLSDPVLFYRLGARFEAAPGQWFWFDLGEEIVPQTGLDADFSLHLGYGWTFSSGNVRN